eukprot:scaffold19146_cov29-Tisochrysis_lutea.AAC.3
MPCQTRQAFGHCLLPWVGAVQIDGNSGPEWWYRHSCLSRRPLSRAGRAAPLAACAASQQRVRPLLSLDEYAPAQLHPQPSPGLDAAVATLPLLAWQCIRCLVCIACLARCARP